jgi:hypothetical protein
MTTEILDDEMTTIPPAVSLLSAFLRKSGYSPHCVGRITAYAYEHGHLEGCRELEAEDRAAADDALERGQPAVPWTSDLWGYDAGFWTPGGGDE